jgi:Cu2+-exporting ATPase
MQSPEDKRKFLADLGHKALFFGDGINDIGAIDGAHCAGTPAIDRPFVASRSDFFTTSHGIRPLIVALAACRAYAATVRLLFCVALAYNIAMVSIALFGALSPLLCAVLMPVSSVTVLLVAIFHSQAAFARASRFQWAQAAPAQGAI